MNTTETSPQGRRLWLMRLMALTLIPVAFVFLTEVALRLGGYGYESGFLIASDEVGTLRSNPQFSRRFFPPRLAREPVPFELEAKGTDVFRIFVVGGSAARGTPEPAFGLARVLEASLELSFPDRRFEVHNAALTAVNSHVALPVVRDLVNNGEADLIVVYLGNNEVVGPYGAASVLGDFAPRLGMLRAAIAVKSWRLGQLFDGFLSSDPTVGGWRGMEMFLDQQVAATDPRLERVYQHFATNLDDLISVAQAAEVEVVVSTVAVNLRDQPPFASLTTAGDQELAESLAPILVEAAAQLQAGNAEAALGQADSALALDASYALAHFERGRALWALGRLDDARVAFELARDLDTLRFRADSRINDVIREVASRRQVPAVDAAAFFASGAGLGSPLPGHRVFLEHVHLNFQGTVSLAAKMLEQILPILGQSTTELTPIMPAQLAQVLPFTLHDALATESSILEIVRRPPFTSTVGHTADLARRYRQRASLQRLAMTAKGLQNTEALYRRRLASHPKDLQAKLRWAENLDQLAAFTEAAKVWQELVTELPSVLAWQRAHAVALGRIGEVDQATQSLEIALDQWPERAAEILVDLGAIHERAGKVDEAENAYRRGAAEDPSSPVPAFNLAALRISRGDLTGAIRDFESIVAAHPNFLPARRDLGVAYERQGELEKAAEVYRQEIESDPTRAAGYAHLGQVLEQQGQVGEALASYAKAVEWEPDYAPAHFYLADFLFARGRAQEAVVRYQTGLASAPRNVQARHNLAKALLQLGDAAQAIEQLREVVAARPSDPTPLADASAAFEALGKADEAKAALEQALALAKQGDDNDLTAALEQRLAVLGS